MTLAADKLQAASVTELASCRLCQSREAFPHFQVAEQMLGSQQGFVYFHCSACGCLQIAELPADLSAYYPAAYYSYRQVQTAGWKRFLRQQRNRAYLGRPSPGGRLLQMLQPYEAMAAVGQLLLAGPINRQSRILDVGCGQGMLVQQLTELGFNQVMGIDPFLSQDLSPQIRSCHLGQLEVGWDLIMFHHSLEHLPDPLLALQQAQALLNPRGWLLVRVPTVDSAAFERFGPDWVQWDPPRHLYLFSRQNLRQLAAQSGLQLRRLYDDSTAFQFWGSLRYQRGQALAGAFSAQERRLFWGWQRQAQQLNQQARGDQIVCWLQKSHSFQNPEEHICPKKPV